MTTTNETLAESDGFFEDDDRIQAAADSVLALKPTGFSPFIADDARAAMEALRAEGVQDVYLRPELPRQIFAAIADKAALLRGEI